MLANSPGSQAAPGDGNAANRFGFPTYSQDSSPLYADRCCRAHDILSLIITGVEIKLKKSNEVARMIIVLTCFGFIWSLRSDVSLLGHFSGSIAGAALFLF